MAKVLGLGGVFFKTADPKALGDWYRRVLGFPINAWGGASFPTTWISSVSMPMVGLSANQVPGTRPANQAPINRSCSGPEGGGLAERRLPRCGPLPLSLLA